MDQLELHNRILYLVKDAKFSTWACDKSQYQGEGYPISMGDYLVSWNGTNNVPCPSWDEVQKVDASALAAFVEDKRKSERNASLKNDLSICAGYESALINDPNLSFSDYLDKLEALQKKM